MAERLDLEAVKRRHAQDDSNAIDGPWNWQPEAHAAHHDRAALISEVEALREALMPFLRTDAEMKGAPDTADYGVYVKCGDIRRARAVLPETETEEK